MIDWFARNTVAANLLMAFIVISGAIGFFNVRAETFPSFTLDMITVEVPYLGAAPEEVEEAVCIRIEEAVQGIEGVKEITSEAYEGRGVVMIEVETGANTRTVLDDVKNNVDAIDTFPAETEKPIIRELISRNTVMELAVSGQADELTLKTIAESIRDDISAMPEVSLVELVGTRPYEISIEVSELALRRHGLTFDDVAQAVRRSSLDLPGGSVRSDSGEILLRTIGQAYRGNEYEDLVLLARADGTRLSLGDVATVVDGFAETDEFARFDNEPTVLVEVLRSGDQSDLTIARAVTDYVDRTIGTLPQGIELSVWKNEASILSERLALMLRNGLSGFGLVFLVLALFLELRLAFWVSLGIPISFLGTVMLMPGLDVTVSVVSTFGFILVLGIVVDDAIMVGENIFRHQEMHGEGLRGSIEGAQEISTPVIFGVLTTVAAFTPMMFVPGMMGKIFIFLPLVVIPCLLFSLVESLNILPAHLSHLKNTTRPPGPLRRTQQMFANGLMHFVKKIYTPVLGVCLRWRYLSFAVFTSILLLTLGLVLGGRIAFHFFPSPEPETIAASVTMPQGTPAHVTSEAIRTLETSAAALQLALLNETGTDVFRHVLTTIGKQRMASAGPGARAAPGANMGGSSSTAGHIGEVQIELVPAQERQMRAEDISNRWRALTEPIPEATQLNFIGSQFSAGDDVDLMLTGPNIENLEAAADSLKGHLASYAGVSDVSDTFEAGKEELKLGIKPAAETLGLSLQDLGRQVRQAFYGDEAQRIQRGRDDIRVMVRYPADQRRSLGDLENMRIRTPAGAEVAFNHVAVVDPGRGFSSIKRVNRNRAVNVQAAVDETITSGGVVNADIENRILPTVLANFPNVRYSFEGANAAQAESIAGLQLGFVIALFGIYALLAIPLKSYIQPLIIMSAIPFGIVGAVWGHVIMGIDFTMFSMMGLVALSGVVVNDSLVMVDFVNRQKLLGHDLPIAVQNAAAVRFRPILLTSLTTFAGLAPLMAGGSIQAAFLVPMAISLSFGVVFATFITLILVPTTYMILEDIKWVLKSLFFQTLQQKVSNP